PTSSPDAGGGSAAASSCSRGTSRDCPQVGGAGTPSGSTGAPRRTRRAGPPRRPAGALGRRRRPARPRAQAACMRPSSPCTRSHGCRSARLSSSTPKVPHVRLADAISIRSRTRKLALFLDEMRPDAATTVLDVGVDEVSLGEAGGQGGCTTHNLLEERYP